jgi:hypothetical protein
MIGARTEQRGKKGKALALGLVVAAFIAAFLLLTAKPPSPSPPERRPREST